MVLTNVNKFVVIIFGVFVLHDQLTLISAVGVMLAMGGGLWYGKARSRMQEFTPATVGSTASGQGHGKAEEEDMTAVEVSPLLKDGGSSTARDEGGAARRV